MKHLFLVLCLWLPGRPGRAATPAPLAPLRIAEQFVAREGWPPLKDYLCCEAAGQAKSQTLGQQIPPRVARTCQLVRQDSATAVVAVELRDSVGRRDFYLHFRNGDDGWKLGAIRNLAMTHLGPPMVALLAAMPPAEVAAYNLKHPDADHAFTLGNLRLWTSADADITAHFRRNQAGFQEMVRLVQEGGYFEAAVAPGTATDDEAANADPAVHALLRRLFLGRVTRRAGGCGSCLAFVIGGRTDSTVGLLYQPQPAQLPAMHPDGLMVLRPLGGGWYLYKTA